MKNKFIEFYFVFLLIGFISWAVLKAQEKDELIKKTDTINIQRNSSTKKHLNEQAVQENDCYIAEQESLFNKDELIKMVKELSPLDVYRLALDIFQKDINVKKAIFILEYAIHNLGDEYKNHYGINHLLGTLYTYLKNYNLSTLYYSNSFTIKYGNFENSNSEEELSQYKMNLDYYIINEMCLGNDNHCIDISAYIVQLAKAYLDNYPNSPEKNKIVLERMLKQYEEMVTNKIIFDKRKIIIEAFFNDLIICILQGDKDKLIDYFNKYTATKKIAVIYANSIYDDTVFYSIKEIDFEIRSVNCNKYKCDVSYQFTTSPDVSEILKNKYPDLINWSYTFIFSNDIMKLRDF